MKHPKNFSLPASLFYFYFLPLWLTSRFICKDSFNSNQPASFLKEIRGAYPKQANTRSIKSVEISSLRSFKSAVIRGREVFASFANSACVTFCSATNAIIFLLTTARTSHSTTTPGLSLNAFASCASVLIVTIFSRFILQPPSTCVATVSSLSRSPSPEFSETSSETRSYVPFPVHLSKLRSVFEQQLRGQGHERILWLRPNRGSRNSDLRVQS